MSGLMGHTDRSDHSRPTTALGDTTEQAMNHSARDRARLATLALALLPLAALPTFAAPPQEAEPTPDEVRPAPLSGAADEDEFTLYLNEEPIMQMSHEWREDGTYVGETTMSLGGQTVETSLLVETDDEGYWTRLHYTATGMVFELTREGGRASVAVDEEEPQEIELKAGMVLYGDDQPALLRQAVEAYDQEKGGDQPIDVLIIPGVPFEATLERLDTTERGVAGRHLEITRYRCDFSAVDLFISADQDDRVLLIDVPAQHATYVRSGFESLLVKPVEDATLSAPDHDWALDDEVMIPMRDGTRLATDVYRPDQEGTWPIVLVRTPYKKEMNELQAKFYARRGYVFAVQDCRGRFGSEGDWVPFFAEPEDGYDTIEWLAKQPFSSGKVGMIGGSYLGWVQWWAAREQPPHLTTIIPNVAPPDPYFNIPYEYGAFFLTGSIWWADVLEQEATADLTGEAMGRVSDKDYHELLMHLPVVELDEKVLGQKNSYWRDWIAHPDNDDWWGRGSFLDHLEGLDIPVFHQSGWFDGDGIGSKLNYLRMASHGHEHQKLVVGPWGHTDTASRGIPGHDFGPAAVIDLQTDYLRWFDHWLKGVDNGIDREPLVKLFAMGSNEWHEGDTYPLPETETQRWYLHSEGSANTSKGDGGLSTTPPALDEPADRYAYDPGDPTPSPRMPRDESADDYYVSVNEEREDILVYQTAPLEKPVTIVGPVSAVLYASTSAKDTDWFVRLSEVNAEGEILFLVEGKIRARYRDSFSKPELLEPGEIAEYHIDCWQTGITLPPGHRLRVEVASAAFPFFSRNLNTGGHNEMETEFVTANQIVYHDAEHPSHVLLPVIPALPAEEGEKR